MEKTEELLKSLSKYNRLLQDLEGAAIIPDDSVRETIMESKRKAVLKLHPYAITPPSADGGRWQTYINIDNARKIIRSRSEEELIEKLIDHYDMHIDKMTFKKLFDIWIKYKSNITESQNTILRHRQHYKRYFENSWLNNTPINKITKLTLTEECNRIVKDNHLSRKEWVNVNTILKGMFFYAKEKHLIKEDLTESVKITVKYRQINRKTGKTETYNTEERDDLFKYLDKKYAETNDIVFIAVKINFFLGLRVAELTTLKWEDIGENAIHVVREEVRNQVTNITSVVEHTKTSRDRFVVLIPKAKDLLEKLPHYDEEFIFVRPNGKRLKSKDVATVLEKYAKIKKIKVKSTHKIRKTYASMLNAAGVPLDAIREELGHTDLNTTLSYIFNPLTDEETYSLIKKAL